MFLIFLLIFASENFLLPPPPPLLYTHPLKIGNLIPNLAKPKPVSGSGILEAVTPLSRTALATACHKVDVTGTTVL